MAENKLGHINERLSDVAINYPQGDFVGNVLFPEKPVNKGSDDYTIYTKDNLFQVVDDTISKRGSAREVQTSSSTASYTVRNRALKDFVPKEDVDNADDPLEPKIDATETVTAAVLLNREMRQAAIAMALSVNTATPGIKWDQANSTPVADMQAAADAMFVYPNVAVISRDVWNYLKYHEDLLALFQGGNVGYKIATPDMLATLLSIDAVYIAKARKNANKKAKSASLSYVWAKSVILARVNNGSGKNIQTFGKTFAQKLTGGKTFRVREWWDDSKGVEGGTHVQVEHRSIEKLISEDFGYYLSACIT